MAYNAVMQAAIQQPNREPIWVIEMIFNHGKHAVEGTKDIYIGTKGVNRIANFPFPERYLPYLNLKNLGSLNQRIDKKLATSTIGSISFVIHDVDNMFSQVIRAAANAGNGLRGQIVELYQLEADEDWANAQKTRTLLVTNVKQNSDGLSYTVSAHDIQSAIQGDVFEPITTKLSVAIASTTATTITLADASKLKQVPHRLHGMAGFIKINDEQMIWTAKTPTHVLTVIRAVNGTTPATHGSNTDVSEVAVVSGNPMYIALCILMSTGTGTNGIYDVYPEHWGLGLDPAVDVDAPELEQVGSAIMGYTAGVMTSGRQYEHAIGKSWSAKTYIESRIFKFNACFARVQSNGRYGARAYFDITQIELGSAQRVLNIHNIVSMTEADFDLPSIVNHILVKYDEQPKLSGKFARTTHFLDSVSIEKNGKTKKPLLIKAEGLIPESIESSALYQVIHLIGAQLSSESKLFSLTLMPSQQDIEVGEICRVTYPRHDAWSGNDMDIVVEVEGVGVHPLSGKPTVLVRAKRDKATFWQGGVGVPFRVDLSPVSVQLEPAATHLMTLRVFDQAGNQMSYGAVIWTATGNVTVDASGLITAGALGTGTIQANVSNIDSNIVTISIQAASVNPIATVLTAPSSASLQVGLTQQFTATAQDLNGSAVNGGAVTWASSNAAIATVDAAGLATAVAEGSTNITATIGGVTSPVVVTSVVPAPVPTYQPPKIADVVYEVGTNMAATWDGSTSISLGIIDTSTHFYWNGDLTIAAGVTLTISGTVHLYVKGTFTNNGIIDGYGLGASGGVAAWTGVPAGDAAAMKGKSGYFGKGGHGTTSASWFYGVTTYWNGGLGGDVTAIAPSISIVPTAQDANGTWTAIAGIPEILHGSGSGAGHSTATQIGAQGSKGGAGLFVMARAIYHYSTSAQINVDGENGKMVNTSKSGGGGGGSVIFAAEADFAGNLNANIVASKISAKGGSQGGTSAVSSQIVSGGTDGYTPSVMIIGQ